VLQALPLVASGAADALQLTDEELALACASHGGERRHARTAAGMLAKAGVDPTRWSAARTGPTTTAPSARAGARGEQPSALHNNCSGKHAGFVCLGCHQRRARRPRTCAASCAAT
jgi:L-asparaginase II